MLQIEQLQSHTSGSAGVSTSKRTAPQWQPPDSVRSRFDITFTTYLRLARQAPPRRRHLDAPAWGAAAASARATVLASSIATVVTPTPPSRGVIQEATSATSGATS